MEILWIFVFLIIFLISYLLYAKRRDEQYFRSRNVYPLPNGGLLGLLSVFYNMIFKSEGVIEIVQKQYATIRKADAKITGNYEFGKESYIVTDLEYLKHILVKDFDHFVNRRPLGVPDSDLLVKKMLIFKNDAEWKGLRSKLSPTFTTGKIKKMFTLFNASSKKLVAYVDARMEESSSGEIDLLEGYSKFTMDTIASAVCNMNSQAFDQVEPSLFERMGQKMQLQFNPVQFISFIVLVSFPKIAKFFKMSLFGSEMYHFFSGAIKSSIHDRQEKGEKRNDFIQLMLEAREDKLKIDESELNSFEKDALIKDSSDKNLTKDSLDDDGIVSNCVLFILAGFDTTQSLLLFCAYALATHPEIQERLRQEVDGVLEDNDGDFTYDSIHKMVYLDMVINETLRFYPPAGMTDRACTQDYTFPPNEAGKTVTIRKGCGIMVPILGIHHDERYYPEPEKFDPERFSAENKGKIPPYAFLAFGQGPRNCIGMRFALTEVKLAIAQLVHNFDIEPSKQTQIPMKFQNAASLKPKNGMWLALKRRPGTKD